MNLAVIHEQAKPGDIILTHGAGFLSDAIGAGQACQTIDGKPSRWSHCLMYIDSLTIAESTIDLKPYIVDEKGCSREFMPESPSNTDMSLYQKTLKRMDNGAQFNDLITLKDKAYGQLICMPLTNEQRQIVIDEAVRLIIKGYTYPISGLVGSLLSFWLLDKLGIGKSNPLQSRHSLSCSAFIQACYDTLQIDFDPQHTARNTSPEMISQYQAAGLKKFIL